MALSTLVKAGLGIKFGVNSTGSGSTFTNLGLLKDDCGFSSWESTIIPLPTISTITLTKTVGRIDYGTFTGSVYLVNADAGVAALQALFAARQIAEYQIMLPDGSDPDTGSTYTFSGFVSTLTPGNFTGEDAPTLELVIAVSGEVVLDLGS